MFSFFDYLFYKSMGEAFKGFDAFERTRISFPKEDDPNFNYTKEEKVEGQFKVINETWTDSEGREVYSKSSTTLLRDENPVKELESQIQKALAVEDYETAAKLKKEKDKLLLGPSEKKKEKA